MTPFQHHNEDWHRRNVRSHAHKPHRLAPMDVADGIAFVFILAVLIVVVALAR